VPIVYLDKVIDVRDEPIHAHFYEHDKCTADVLTHLTVLVRWEKEQVLQIVINVINIITTFIVWYNNFNKFYNTNNNNNQACVQTFLLFT